MPRSGPASEPDPPITGDTEEDKLFWFRAGRLLDAGYSVAGALMIAQLPVDLHKAEELMFGGCDEGTALDILL